MSGDPEPRYVLRRITPSEWVINDQRYETDDPRHVVACVYDADGGVEVVRLRDLPLEARYANASEVLEAVMRAKDPSRATRPIVIPSHPPLFAK